MRIANRYELGDVLGQGGVGIVYRARDTNDDTTVAVKQLNVSLTDDDLAAMIERFRREGDLLRRLNHPNIVKVFDAVQDGDQYYLVMELVEGGTLSDVLKSGQGLSVSRVIQIGLDLADALTRAHRLGIIHRDLKPANILLDKDGVPHLSDFGIAHIHGSDITLADQILGTLSYLSPEAMMSKPIDERSDIWSFGVVLFELLAGRRLFADAPVGVMVQNILTKPIPELELIRPDVPIALVDLINRMLAREPGDRISSVRIVGAELEALLHGIDAVPITSNRTAQWTSGVFQTPTPSTGFVRNNLPPQSTAFVGREKEIAELVDLLRTPTLQLITILAAGGMGKTRLSLEVAQQFADQTRQTPSNRHFNDGVYFVPLASLSTSEHIITTMAETFGYIFQQDGRPARQQILDYLQDKQLLLIFDNFEHLLDASILINDILQASRHIKVMTTSRARLNLTAERVYPLEGMPFPQSTSNGDWNSYSSINLFVQSATRLRPDFTPQEWDWLAIAQICKEMQGMPLGIVLAAGWIETLTCPEIADEVARGIDILETELRDVPERQRSIRAVFDYSYNLLNADEQQVFKKLAVFRGGFSRQAVQQITGASLRTLTTLNYKSLLRRDVETGRYEVHPFVRQYAESRLQSAEKYAIENDHSAYYATLMEQRTAALKGQQQLNALDEIEIDFENFRCAWDWACRQRREDRIRGMLEGLHLFCQMRARTEDGNAFFHQARQQLVNAPIYRCLLSRYPDMNGDPKAALEQALELSQQAGDQPEVGFCYHQLGMAILYHDMPTAAIYFEKALETNRKLNRLYEIAQTQGYLLICYGVLGRYGESAQSSQESLQLRRQIGDKIGAAETLYNLAAVSLYQQGQYDLARSFFDEALGLRHEMRDRAGVASTLEMIAKLDLMSGDFANARRKVTEAQKLALELNAPFVLAFVMNTLAMLECIEKNLYEKSLDHTEKAKSLSSAQFVIAASEFNLLLAHTGMNHDALARQYLTSAMAMLIPLEGFVLFVWCLPLVAAIAARAGNLERAAELLALAYAQPPAASGYLNRWTLATELRQQIEQALGANSPAWQRGQMLNVREQAFKFAEEFGA